MIDEKKFNKWLNAFILAGTAIAVILTTILKIQNDARADTMLIVSAVGSLMGVLSSVCSANAKVQTFIFGVFDVTIYGVMCILGGSYGNGALKLLYFLPMQFIGFYNWKRRGASSSTEVNARRLSPKRRRIWLIILVLGCFAAAPLLWLIARLQGDSIVPVQIGADAVSMVCNMIGLYLMSAAYTDQWYFWIGVNVFSIVMWTARLMSGDASASFALIYMIKYSFYLVNSLNGLRIWLRLSRRQS